MEPNAPSTESGKAFLDATRSSVAPRQRGRRPGNPDTRHAILRTARESFARFGYEKTTVRDVARRCGVDPSLVLYFFSSKDNLFHEAVVETLQFMIPPSSVFASGPHFIAERLLIHVLSQWECPVNRNTLLAVIRSTFSHEKASCELRKFFHEHLLPPFSATLRKPNPLLRCTFVSSHLTGLVIMRYVVRLTPLAELERSEVVQFVAPTLHHYITGDL